MEKKALRSKLIVFLSKELWRLKKRIFNVEILISIVGLIVVYLIFGSNNNIYIRGFGILFIFLFAIIIYFILKRIYNHKGGDFIIAENPSFSLDTENQLINLNLVTNKIEERNISLRFATRDDIDKITDLNLLAYKKSVWDVDKAQKKKRNLSHIERNDYSILCIVDSGGTIIGFTHIFPVNKDIWDRYNEGTIADNTFPASKIVAKTTKRNNSAYGLILFSIALPHNKKKKLKRNEKLDNGLFVQECVAHHFDHYLKREFIGKETVPMLFQNFDRDLLKYYDPVKTNPEILSKDGAKIVCAEIVNHHHTKD